MIARSTTPGAYRRSETVCAAIAFESDLAPAIEAALMFDMADALGAADGSSAGPGALPDILK